MSGTTTDRYDKFVFGENAKWILNLCVLGEARAVKVSKDGKTGDQGQGMMFIGYPSNRESDTVRMQEPSTIGDITTCDVIWMQ